MWCDGKLFLCDQRDGQVFMTIDCNIPTACGFQIVTDERTPVLVENHIKSVIALRCHVGHTMIFHHPLPSAVLLRNSLAILYLSSPFNCMCIFTDY